MGAGFRQWLAALAVPRPRRKELSDFSRARSAGRLHPAFAGLHYSVNALLGWTKAPGTTEEAAARTAWVGAGMDHLGDLLSGLTDLLLHLQVQGLERRRCQQMASWWTERLFGDLILLADAHGLCREVLVSLKQLLAEAQAAVRRHGNAARLAATLGQLSTGRHHRDLSRLASTLHVLSHRRPSSSTPAGEAALAEAVTAATCAAASGSAAIFVGLASRFCSISSSSALGAFTSLTAASPAEAMERLRSLEKCAFAAEDGSQQVHRALVNTMKPLLNVLTHS
uniref:Uncharacterized protein n=1 Tax=Avena sativa TaxID=4498 RepID=A0ACD5TQI0_AVESA